MEPDITALTAAPDARTPLEAFSVDLARAIAACRAADLMTQLAARPGPRLDWTVDGIVLVGRPVPEATPAEGCAAVASWAARLCLALTEGSALGDVEGVAVRLHTDPPTPPHGPETAASSSP
ncbi:hypothetical protein ACRYCC_26525 [Actinomadura scrupuli]|uniref:hypothetical protein n=1 Tax=Actinomadura scrupuli TaxID=559629 RepID=UPI003D957AD5